jgi:hypothetical protein
MHPCTPPTPSRPLMLPPAAVAQLATADPLYLRHYRLRPMAGQLVNNEVVRMWQETIVS